MFQCAIHHPDVPGSFAWFREVAKVTGHPVTFNFVQTDQYPDLWREVLGHLEQAAAEDLPIWGQCTGRPIGILQCWDGTVHPFKAHRAWKEIEHLPASERLTALREPARRQALIETEGEPDSGFVKFITTSWNKMYPMVGDAVYEPAPEDSVAAIAAATGRTPAEVAYDHMLETDGTGVIYFPLFNFSQETLDPLREMHRHPRTRMGLADAGAHCATICDGAMPTFMLSFWTRDRSRGELMDLEHVVARQTSGTAQHYGLRDRGVVAPGYRADINIIDYDALGVDRPVMANDLPTGAQRFVQRARGYRATICAGEVVAEHGEFTGATPGRLIRGPQSGPTA